MVKVKVVMSICGNESLFDVVANEDGTFQLMVESTCHKARALAKELEVLSMEDLVDKRQGRIYQRFLESDMSANCSVPSGIITAAWLEAGLISKNLARQKKGNEVQFIID